ncbi:MAG: endolytic transglycosylase MltG [Oscillatoriaceae cyanobacterium]
MKLKTKPTRKVTTWPIIYGAIVVLGFAGVASWQVWAWWVWAISPPKPVFPDETANATPPPVNLVVKQGTSGNEIGTDLHQKRLIRSMTAWKLWTRLMSLKDRTGGFQAGTYEIDPNADMNQIATQIWSGQVKEVSFTIREGWTMKQMAAHFESLGFFSAQAFLDAAKQIPYDKYPWLPKKLPHLEGFLYPDTYVAIVDNLSPQAVITQMLQHFESQALPVYEQGKNQTKLNLLEWVTMASIVEREAVIAEERPIIAGVFARRLEEVIPLGSDPTVEYAFGITQTKERPLTYKEVSTPSPYNTYINFGLPPTPIGSPGLSSLKASLNPEKTEYLYFMSRYDGTHIFSRTLAEHEAAIRQVEAEIQQGR